MTIIHVDASFNPHTKLASVGVPFKRVTKLLRARTPTEAELLAILCGVSVSNPGDVIVTDCMTIVSQFTQGKLIKGSERLTSFVFNAIIHLGCGLRWTPRHRNRKANNLARKFRSR